MFSLVGILKGLLIQNEVDRTKQFQIEVSPSATTGTKTTLQAAQTVNTTIVLPNGSTTLVGTDNSQTLTNKTFDADLNTISNIDDNEIKALAGIDATKIADGSVSNAEFQALNGASGTLVSTNAVQTLTNKTIDADSNTLLNIDDNEIRALAGIDATKIADGSVSNAEFQALNGVTGTIVSENGTQTLTNKTIDADLNTISNIEDADIKVSANIARNKLASGSANHVIINDGSGVLSSEAQLAITRGGSGQSTANAALNAFLPSQATHSGEFLTTDGSNASWASTGGGAVGDIELYVDSLNGHASTFSDVPRFSNSRKNTLGAYATYTDSATNGATVTIAASGVGLWQVQFSYFKAGAVPNLGIAVNGTNSSIVGMTYANGKRAITSTGSAANLGQVSTVLYLYNGDVVQPVTDQTTNAATSDNIIFSMIYLGA